MDQVRENITKFITNIYNKYQFKDKNILEIGTGHMGINQKLFGPANNFIATDTYQTPFSDEILDITSIEKCIERFGEGNLDVIIMSEVLEHVYNYPDAFESCYRLLHDGGYILITVPWEYPEHGDSDYWRYSKLTLDRLMNEWNFDIAESSEGFDGEKKTNLFRLGRKRVVK